MSRTLRLIALIAFTGMPITDSVAQEISNENSRANSEKQDAQPAKSKCDEACVRANADRASSACARRIEAQSDNDFEWITRPFTGIFQQADPSKDDNAIVQYRGDSIRFMSPQRTWVRVSYECSFDAEKAAVVGVRVRPGRLDRPVALQSPSSQQPANSNTSDAPQGAAQQKPIASAPLAAAIMQAAKQRSAPPQNAEKPPRLHIGEPSPIDISQISRRRGVW